MRVIQNTIALLIAFLIFEGCNTIDKVSPQDRNTFIKFYGGTDGNEADDFAPTSDGGYILLGKTLRDGKKFLDLIKTDARGNIEFYNQMKWVSGNAILPVSDGYLIIGDSIKQLPGGKTLTSILLMKTDLSGNHVFSFTYGDPLINHQGKALTIDQNGDVILLGIRQSGIDQDQSLVMKVSLSDLSVPQWVQTYGLLDRDYEVTPHIIEDPGGHFVWASSAIKVIDTNAETYDDIVDSYITIDVVNANSEHINQQKIGDIVPANYFVKDIHKGSYGYTIAGITNDTDAGDRDLFFCRLDNFGNLIAGTEKKYGYTGDDEGLSLTYTQDGGYLIFASMTTTLEEGNGGKDIYLAKVDPFGDLEWENLIGGSGDESGRAVIQTKDGGYILFGTQSYQGASMMFLVKTNKEGQLIE